MGAAGVILTAVWYNIRDRGAAGEQSGVAQHTSVIFVRE